MSGIVYPDAFCEWFYNNPFGADSVFHQLSSLPVSSVFQTNARCGWDNPAWSLTWQDALNLAAMVLDD